MAKDLWHDSTKSIPKSDPKVERIDWDENQIGARKSHTSGAHRKNSFTINHVKS